MPVLVYSVFWDVTTDFNAFMIPAVNLVTKAQITLRNRNLGSRRAVILYWYLLNEDPCFDKCMINISCVNIKINTQSHFVFKVKKLIPSQC